MQFQSVGTVMHELNRIDAQPLAELLQGHLLRALRPFLTAAAIGLPPGQDGTYLLSCPGRQGTVWRVEATE